MTRAAQKSAHLQLLLLPFALVWRGSREEGAGPSRGAGDGTPARHRGGVFRLLLIAG